MRRTLAAAAVLAGLAAPVLPLPAANACYYDLGKVCVPSECMIVAIGVRTVNDAAGRPLGSNPPPHCID